MKNLLLLFFALLISVSSFSQNYITKTGHIWFFSDAPLEDIEAHNYQVTSILKKETGEMVFKVLMKGFRFEKSLMQEHFNEKYVESDKYPEATFKGKITNPGSVNFDKPGVYDVTVSGDLTIHGVTQPVTAKGTLEVVAAKITAKSKFSVKVEDYKISIPGAVKDNIAKVIDINVEMGYEPLK